MNRLLAGYLLTLIAVSGCAGVGQQVQAGRLAEVAKDNATVKAGGFYRSRLPERQQGRSKLRSARGCRSHQIQIGEHGAPASASTLAPLALAHRKASASVRP